MNFSYLLGNCRIISLTLILFQLCSCSLLPVTKSATPSNLEAWLKTAPALRPAFASQSFAHQTLAVDACKEQQKRLYENQAKTLHEKLKSAWDKQVFSWNKYQMPLKFKLFGNPTMGQRSLFLSMHGGGGTAASVNDQQWKNQLNLYQPKEGLYIAPRAPTNTWNLWHQAHIDPLFDQIINAAVLFEGVDPNRIYLTGYSAGGDGTFQLAARMGDRFAAAAMMAGHPNEVKVESMRNLPFALYMGANDSAYERNKKALAWKKDLRRLHQKDPKGYQHKVEIVVNKGHWMDRIDTAAISWMQEFRRNVRPNKIVWIQDDVHQEQSYWLQIPKSLARTGQKIIASCHKNHIQIEENYSDTLYIYLDKQMIDADKPVLVSFKETLLYKNKVHGTLFNIYRNLQRRLDIDMAFPVCLVLLKNEAVMLNPTFD